jgi:hypothetical protein
VDREFVDGQFLDRFVVDRELVDGFVVDVRHSSGS